MLRERLKFDIGLIFTCSLMTSFFLTNFEYGADKNMGIFLGLLDYKKLDSDLYEFSFNGFSFFLVFVFSLFFVFVILYLLSFLYCDMKYLMPERGGLSKKEYNLRFRTLEDIIKTCTNEKKLEEFMNSFDLESKAYFPTQIKENKHKHKRESKILLLYQPVLKKFLTKYQDKAGFVNAIMNLRNEVAKRFFIKEKGFWD